MVAPNEEAKPQWANGKTQVGSNVDTTAKRGKTPRPIVYYIDIVHDVPGFYQIPVPTKSIPLSEPLAALHTSQVHQPIKDPVQDGAKAR